MRVVYRGNFQPDLPAHLNGGVPWSTETHVAAAWEAEGHEVIRQQEDTVPWERTVAEGCHADLVLWTSTFSMAQQWARADAEAALRGLEGAIPTAFWHLDRWWGLDREIQIRTEPWARCAFVFTADGGHDKEWATAGVNHRWLPPAVDEGECELGEPSPEFYTDVAFVGRWRPGYHQEWPHRAQLIDWLRRRYGGRVGFWPRGPQVRGRALANLYASVPVIVGDSCLVGGTGRFISDRVPETLGRGGFLIHPHVEGVTDGGLWTAGEHLACWTVGDWDGLGAIIEQGLANPERRRKVAEAGRQHTLAHHTYRHRVREVIAAIRAEA